MAPSPLQCPSCGSVDLRRVDVDTWRCNACDAELVREVAGAPLVVRVPGRPPSRLPLAALGRAAAIVAVVAAVGFGVWKLATRVTPDAADQLEFRPTDPDFDFRDQAEGKTATGDLFWLQTWRNLDRLPVGRPAMIAKLFDADAKLIGRFRGEAVESRVGPGEEIVILVVAPGVKAYTDAEVRSEKPAFAEPDPLAVPLGTEKLEIGEDAVHGTLVNLGKVPARVVRVAVVGRRADGSPVVWADAKPEQEVLEPRARTPFVAPLDAAYRIGPPEAWTATASAVRAE